MAFPVNIEDLINSRTVESTRKEFKKGWNPEEVIHSICAFANDINELGGGYIFIGIEEIDGTPILPPEGLQQNQIDGIQKKFLELCNLLQPKIFPEIEVVELQGKHIIIIWVTTGEERPYNCPSTLGKKSQRRIYVRPTSASIPASYELEKKLRELAIYKHFDDRINTKATLDDLDLGLILSYLQETKAQLYESATKLPFEELCLKMGIARGPKENIKPLNIGLLIFSKNPEKYFEGCTTNLVEFEDEAGTKHSSKTFKGSVHEQIRKILEYLESNIVKEFGFKEDASIQSDSFSNYPLLALRESIVNASYHRNYEVSTPNEIRIYKNGSDRRIEILSYDGPMPPIDENALVQLKISAARNYRNIKLGDWLKQIQLAEKFATGIPTIVNELDKNGSPKPILSTDESRSYFTVVIKIHPDTPDENGGLGLVSKIRLTNTQQQILENLQSEPLQLDELVSKLGRGIVDDIHFLEENGLIQQKQISKKMLLIFDKSISIFFVTNDGIDALKRSF